MMPRSTRLLSFQMMRPRSPRLGLPLDQLQHPGPQRGRRHQQLPVLDPPAVAGQVVEQVGQVGSQLRRRGQDADVLVHASRAGVVVAGADVAVAADAVALLAHDQGRLGMGLQPDQPVHHVHARFFERPGPPDVGRLVTPGLQLDQRRHLLALLGRPDQSLDDGAVARRAVQRLLDGQHLRVA